MRSSCSGWSIMPTHDQLRWKTGDVVRYDGKWWAVSKAVMDNSKGIFHYALDPADAPDRRPANVDNWSDAEYLHAILQRLDAIHEVLLDDPRRR